MKVSSLVAILVLLVICERCQAEKSQTTTTTTASSHVINPTLAPVNPPTGSGGCSGHSHGDLYIPDDGCYAYYYQCVHAKASRMPCSTGLVFDTTTNECNQPSKVAGCSAGWKIYVGILNSSYIWNDSLADVTSEFFRNLSEIIQSNKTVHVVSFERTLRVIFRLKNLNHSVEVDNFPNIRNITLPPMQSVYESQSDSFISLFTGPPQRESSDRFYHVLRFPVHSWLTKNSSEYNNTTEYMKYYIECLYSVLSIEIDTLELEYGNIWTNLVTNDEIIPTKTAINGIATEPIFERLMIVEANFTGSSYLLDAPPCFKSVTTALATISDALRETTSTSPPKTQTATTWSPETPPGPEASMTTAYSSRLVTSTRTSPSRTARTPIPLITRTVQTSDDGTPHNTQTKSDASSLLTATVRMPDGTTHKTQTTLDESTLSTESTNSIGDVLRNTSAEDITTEAALYTVLKTLDTALQTNSAGASDMNGITNLLQSVAVNFKNSSLKINPSTLGSAAGLVSSLLTEVTDTGNTQSFIKVVEDFGLLVQIPEDQKFVAIATKSFTLKLGDANPDEDFDIEALDGDTALSDVKIPESALPKSKGKIRVITNTFRDPSIFPSSEGLSMVVSVKVGDGKISNLGERIAITFTEENATSKKLSIPGTLKANKTTFECVFYDKETKQWSTSGCYLNTGRTSPACEVDHLTSFAIIANSQEVTQDVALSIVSQIGCILSILGLFLTIVLYLHSKKWRRNQPAMEILHVCFNLIIAYVIFLAGVSATANRPACIAVTALLQYFYLVTWCWIGIYTRDMYISLVKVYSKRTSHYLTKVTAFAYALPFIFVVIHASVAVAHFDNQESNMIKTTHGAQYKGSTYFAENVCWLQGYSLYFGFLLPVAIVLIHNLVSFGIIIYEVAWRSDSIDSSAKKKTATSKLQLAIVVGTLVGLTWIFGFLLLISQDPVYAQVMSWFFALFNSTQGLSMFLILCVRSKDIRQTWWPPIQEKLCPSAFRSRAARRRNFRHTISGSFYSESTRPTQASRRATYASSSFYKSESREVKDDSPPPKRDPNRSKVDEFDKIDSSQKSPEKGGESKNGDANCVIKVTSRSANEVINDETVQV